MALSELLDHLLKVYAQKRSYLDELVANYTLKVEDLSKCAVKIEEELENIKIRMNENVEKIGEKYTGEKGLIARRAEVILDDYKETMEVVDDYDDDYLYNLGLLETFAFRRVGFLSNLSKNTG